MVLLMYQLMMLKGNRGEELFRQDNVKQIKVMLYCRLANESISHFHFNPPAADLSWKLTHPRLPNE